MNRWQFVAVAAASAAIGYLSHPSTVVLTTDDRNQYWLYNNIVEVAAGMSSGLVIGSYRRELAAKLIGDAPFLGNVKLVNVCVDVYGNEKPFYAAGALLQNDVVASTSDAAGDVCDSKDAVTIRNTAPDDKRGIVIYSPFPPKPSTDKPNAG